MALSFSNVQNAYKVFNEIKKTVLPELRINSWPEDMADWSERERENPHLCKVYGFDRKSDDGWESLVFFVKNPSDELKQKFDELKSMVRNSSIARPYGEGSNIWKFGWF
ncbi:hypothetical protein SDC9_145687 [bioreactor metagenome]|uniref:Uncharacterized protein n=1 Tax=bioreactor metagenome TaxID=1076179 RepID=A0A645EB04_9ZZZZ|nr:hypothetical protein [Proteiniphilum sp.]MEA4918126.1 hypothetical protein [Proteiniphilum sp.]